MYMQGELPAQNELHYFLQVYGELANVSEVWKSFP